MGSLDNGSSRRGFLKRAGMLTALAGSGLAAPRGAGANEDLTNRATIEPFFGVRQGGILTTPQRHSYFAAFDLDTANRDDVKSLLRDWTAASAALTKGEPAPASGAYAPADSGDTLGLSPARLTLTFGFGAGLFVSNGKDRYGLAALRPEALIDLPAFPGEQLVEARTGGDLSVQACADDPQVAFHAIRHLSELTYGVARVRWGQVGFLPDMKAGETPRNLMGFKDGTGNPSASDNAAMAKFVFVGDEGPVWMRGGSYAVARRILIGLEHWDRTGIDFQERVIGRHRETGAPLGMKNEFDAVDLDELAKDGAPMTPLNSHVRLATAASNEGTRILRRPYSYNDGVSHTAERWPPWRQSMSYDAGLFFVCYQRDPRDGFVKIFSRLAKHDMLNQFSVHTGGGLFACPPGIGPREFVGEKLFST